MCIEIHLPDGRVIEGVDKDSREAVFEGDDIDNSTCLCWLDFSQIMTLIAVNLPPCKGRQLLLRYDFAMRIHVCGWVEDMEASNAT